MGSGLQNENQFHQASTKSTYSTTKAELHFWQLTNRTKSKPIKGSQVAIQSPASQGGGNDIEDEVEEQQWSRQASSNTKRHSCIQCSISPCCKLQVDERQMQKKIDRQQPRVTE